MTPLRVSIEEEDRRILGRAVTGQIIACALRVHHELGPGLLESAYRACLMHDIQEAGLEVASELLIPVTYRGKQIDCGYRADLVVEGRLLVELKAVERLLPVHEAQVLTYLKVARLRVGLLINFNTSNLRNCIRRFVV